MPPAVTPPPSALVLTHDASTAGLGRRRGLLCSGTPGPSRRCPVPSAWLCATRADRGFARCRRGLPAPRVFSRPGRPSSSRRRAPAAAREINNRGRVTPGDCSTFLREINNITHARCCPGDFAPSAHPPHLPPQACCTQISRVDSDFAGPLKCHLNARLMGGRWCGGLAISPQRAKHMQ